MKKEKIINDTVNEKVKTAENDSVDFEKMAEPTVIRLEADKSYRDEKYSDDEDKNYRRSNLRKRPKDDTLFKMSAVSFILGVLCCTICLGNIPLAVIGIMLGLTATANKYKTVYTKAGLILSFVGCGLGVILSLLAVVLIVGLIIALLGLLALAVWGLITMAVL